MFYHFSTLVILHNSFNILYWMLYKTHTTQIQIKEKKGGRRRRKNKKNEQAKHACASVKAGGKIIN